LPLARAHAQAADALTEGHRDRAPRQQRHPVEDFLFEYYSVRPSVLRRWHPGIGVGLEDASDHAEWSFYQTDAGVTSVDVEAFWAARESAVGRIVTLLRATASRPARLGCFGLHEWAMAYRVGDDLRHPLPLRLGQAGTDAVVESHPIACSHFDAYRFFTPDALPLNVLRPTRATQSELEQPGCLHANMDLYKWCAKLAPAVPSALTLEAFALAMRVRYLDMRASPYDVTAMGLEPVRIETPEGKREYAECQAEFAVEAAALRERLIEACAHVSEAAAG
jgi:hypothetical protein